VFPNVTPDTYTVEITLEAFKTVRRAGIVVSGGDRVGIPRSRWNRVPSPKRDGDRGIAMVQTRAASVVRGHEQADREPADRAQQFHQPDGLHPGVVGTGASAGGTRLVASDRTTS